MEHIFRCSTGLNDNKFIIRRRKVYLTNLKILPTIYEFIPLQFINPLKFDIIMTTFEVPEIFEILVILLLSSSKKDKAFFSRTLFFSW